MLLHDLSKLANFKAQPPMKWMTIYRPDRMAGLQAVLQAWKAQGSLLFLNNNLPYDKLSDSEKKEISSVQYFSGTPSHFKWIDHEVIKSCKSLISIILGGEPVTQNDIQRLKVHKPAVSIIHIYASSEFGAMATVKDELAGLPSSFFEGHEPRFLINDCGELFVKPFSTAVNLESNRSV